MKKALTLFLLFFVSNSIFAQSKKKIDTLSVERTVFSVNVYRSNGKISFKNQGLYFNNFVSAKKKFNASNIMLISSPLVTASGIYLMVDGIKGKTLYANVNGESVEYVDRSLKKIIGGIALVIGGGVLFEYSKDLKIKAVEIYNNGQKNNNLTLKFGLTPTGKAGFYANFY